MQKLFQISTASIKIRKRNLENKHQDELEQRNKQRYEEWKLINDNLEFYDEPKTTDQVVDQADDEAQVVSESKQPDTDLTDNNAVQDPQDDGKAVAKGPKIDDNVELKICDLGNG